MKTSRWFTLVLFAFPFFNAFSAIAQAGTPIHLPTGIFVGKHSMPDIPSQPCKFEIYEDTSGNPVIQGYIYNGRGGYEAWDFPLTNVRPAGKYETSWTWVASYGEEQDRPNYFIGFTLNDDDSIKSAFMTYDRGWGSFSTLCEL